MEWIKRPQGKVPVVLDTDAYNEVDDQFAIGYLLRSGQRVDLQAIYAAPFYDEKRSFYNFKSDSPKSGMESSYLEIQKLLRLAGIAPESIPVFRGADRFMLENGPVDSPAVQDLIQRGMTYTQQKPLYVIAIGAPTNVASALLMQPALKERLVVIWLGGNALDWPTCREFNLSQDLKASQVLFDPKVRLVQVPCMGVASAFTVSCLELKQYLLGKDPLCDYLARTVMEAMGDPKGEKLWSRILWDVTACAWIMADHLALDRPEKRVMPTDTVYIHSDEAGSVNYVYYIPRDALLLDLIRKLTS